MLDRGEALADTTGRRIGSAADRVGPDRLLDRIGSSGADASRTVADLPVGGPSATGGGMVELARQAAVTAIASLADEAGLAGASSAPDPAANAAGGPSGGSSSPGTGPGTAASDGGEPAGGLPAAAAETTEIQGATGPTASAAADPYTQLSELVESLEERLLAEIERRGGRFAGVF